jgi:hypothetical protein
MTGWTKKKYLGEKWKTAVIIDDLPKVLFAKSQTDLTGNLFCEEYGVESSSGKIIRIQSLGFPILRGGRRVGITGRAFRVG